MGFSNTALRNLTWVVIAVFFSIFTFSILSYASTIKLEKQNEKIEKKFDGFFIEISEIKVMILEAELERTQLKDEVQESDINYQLKMKSLQERINKLQKEYANEN